MKNIQEAKDPALRSALTAMNRAAAAARKLAIQTGTDLIIVKDGKLTRISAQELLRIENCELRKDRNMSELPEHKIPKTIDHSFPLPNSQFSIPNPPQEIGERAFAFAVRVVKLCRVLEKTPGVSRTMANQLLRSGTSIGANLEESKGGQSRADFLAKVYISLKEARETHYWLRLLIATEIIAESQLTPLSDECNQIIAILTAIVKTTKENNKKA